MDLHLQHGWPRTVLKSFASGLGHVGCEGAVRPGVGLSVLAFGGGGGNAARSRAVEGGFAQVRLTPVDPRQLLSTIGQESTSDRVPYRWTPAIRTGARPRAESSDDDPRGNGALPEGVEAPAASASIVSIRGGVINI